VPKKKATIKIRERLTNALWEKQAIALWEKRIRIRPWGADYTPCEKRLKDKALGQARPMEMRN
jgi:hypothetical protein